MRFSNEAAKAVGVAISSEQTKITIRYCVTAWKNEELGVLFLIL